MVGGLGTILGPGQSTCAAHLAAAVNLLKQRVKLLPPASRLPVPSPPPPLPCFHVHVHCLGDATAVDVSAASVIALYMSESGNKALLGAAAARGGGLRPGARVVSLNFSVGGWEERLVRVDKQVSIPIYLYRVGDEGAGPQGE